MALLRTFGDQAAIALENVRLFNETKEALDQQRASGEVLAAISSSIADTTPVFDKILTSCERLFEGKLVQINLIGDDGLIHLGAHHGPRARPDREDRSRFRWTRAARPAPRSCADRSSITPMSTATTDVPHSPARAGS